MATRNLQLILGPPGTGKTTTLLKIVARHISEGIPPHRIAFVSFTKKAATEAAHRAAEDIGLSRTDLGFFRTLHSLAYRSLGVEYKDVISRNDYREIASLLGVEFRGYTDTDMADGVYHDTAGDAMLQMLSLARATGRTSREIWEGANVDIDWYIFHRFEKTIECYKQDTGKLDFNDMLSRYTSSRIQCDVDVAIIDEAQDLSNAQWDMAKVAFRSAKHIYLAGDDDQAIYEWAGANLSRFLGLRAERSVLPITYRLPKDILAVTTTIAGRIKRRYPKEFTSLPGRVGDVSHHHSIDSVEVTDGSWMLLARNAIFLAEYEQFCRQHGIAYHTKTGPSVQPEHLLAIRAWVDLQRGKDIGEDAHALIHMLCRSPKIQLDLDWHDALVGIPAEDREYYRSILRAGRRLTACGDVYIGTIHSVKGGEADNVVLVRDMTARTAAGFDANPDAEHRVWYVGASRARERLHIIQPQTAESYGV